MRIAPGYRRDVYRAAALALLLLVAATVAGCGATDDLRERAEERFVDVRREAEQIGREAERLGRRAGEQADQLRERLRRRVRETLERIRQTVPAASRPAPVRRPDTRTEAFLVDVIESVDEYWTTTLTAADIPQPHVGYVFPGPGEQARSACGAVADQDSAFYCPADDTIFIGQRIALRVLATSGDFGTAFIVAHEYAHNVQQELGWFTAGRRLAVKPFELQADCMAGAWANSVYAAGQADPADVNEAQRTAEAVGDFDRLNPQHHGTPAERRAAWTAGFDTGDPAACRQYVPR